jgi:hypothetical protein
VVMTSKLSINLFTNQISSVVTNTRENMDVIFFTDET